MKEGEFLLHMGRKSEYYIDLRTLPSYPEDFDKITTIFSRLVAERAGDVDRIVGAAHGAAPLTVAVSMKLGKPYALVMKIESENSFRNALHGEVKPGERTVLLDDVASSGITLACMAAIVRAYGGSVDDAVVLIDRELGAERLLRTFGVKLHSLVLLGELL